MTDQTMQFQAEVTRLLHIVTHALYSQKDIFLRELISMLPMPATSCGLPPRPTTRSGPATAT